MKSLRLLSLPIALFLFLSLATVSTVKAQPVKIGITSGVNISTHLNKFRFSDGDINIVFTPNVTSGFHGGFIVRKEITKAIRIQAEPSLMVLGANYNEPFTLRGFEFQADSRTKLLYVQLPLLVQWSTVPPVREVYGRQFSETTYHLTGGLYGGYLTYARFEGTNSGEPLGITFAGEFSNNVRSQYKDYDGGAVIGIGLEHGHDNKIGIELRGQISVFKTGDSSNPSFEPQNIAGSVSVYYLF